MFSLSNIIIRTEICPIENETLIEVKMALIFAKMIILFQVACRLVELRFHYWITIAQCAQCACAQSKSNKQK